MRLARLLSYSHRSPSLGLLFVYTLVVCVCGFLLCSFYCRGDCGSNYSRKQLEDKLKVVGAVKLQLQDGYRERETMPKPPGDFVAKDHQHKFVAGKILLCCCD